MYPLFIDHSCRFPSFTSFIVSTWAQPFDTDKMDQTELGSLPPLRQQFHCRGWSVVSVICSARPLRFVRSRDKPGPSMDDKSCGPIGVSSNVSSSVSGVREHRREPGRRLGGNPSGWRMVNHNNILYTPYPIVTREPSSQLVVQCHRRRLHHHQVGRAKQRLVAESFQR